MHNRTLHEFDFPLRADKWSTDSLASSSIKIQGGPTPQSTRSGPSGPSLPAVGGPPGAIAEARHDRTATIVDS